MSRLNPATTLEELIEILNDVEEFGLGAPQAYLQFRPRSSSSENNWTVVDEDHLINLEANNYRIGDAPRLSLDGKVVTVRDEDGDIAANVPVEQVRNAVRMVRKARRNKQSVERESDEEGNPFDDYELIINADGSVKVGCQSFEFDEVEAFANEQGW